MDVRRLRPGDGQLAAAALGLAEGRVGLAPDGAVVEGFLRKDANILLVAFSGPSPLGFLVGYVLERHDGVRPMVCLYEIGVAPGHRRRGVGTALVRALLTIARRLDAVKTWSLTHRSNEAAVRLFQETGGVAETSADDADRLFVWRRAYS